jgi:hypothetical protein
VNDELRVKVLDVAVLTWLVAVITLPAYSSASARLALFVLFLPMGRELLRGGPPPDHVRLVRNVLAILTCAAVIYVASDATSFVAFVTAVWHTYDTQLEASPGERRRRERSR